LSPGLPVNPQNDPDLQAILDALPSLTPDARKRVKEFVRACLERDQRGR
jgi:hypothetical protein